MLRIFAFLRTGLAALLLLTAVAAGPASAGNQKTDKAHPKSVEIIYVCPMHANVQSKTRGTCPKCKMTMVKRRAPKKSSSSHSSH